MGGWCKRLTLCRGHDTVRAVSACPAPTGADEGYSMHGHAPDSPALCSKSPHAILPSRSAWSTPSLRELLSHIQSYCCCRQAHTLCTFGCCLSLKSYECTELVCSLMHCSTTPAIILVVVSSSSGSRSLVSNLRTETLDSSSHVQTQPCTIRICSM